MCIRDSPATTPASDALSKALKKRGFKFIGSTICYAFMQASGLVNDHVATCFCYPGGDDDPALQKVAAMDEEDVERLVQDAGIIRHRGKIQAIIANARAFLAMEAAGEPFSEFVWSFVEGQPRLNRPATLAEIPATTPASCLLYTSDAADEVRRV